MAHPVSMERKSRYLLAASLDPKTQKKYKLAVCEFLQWIRDNNEDATTPDDFDDLLMDYIHELYGSGKGKSKATNTVYGIINYLPKLKKKLNGSKLCIKGWNKLHKSKSYPPLTWQLAMVIALQMTRRRKYDMAVGVLLAFDCFLRVGELVNINREDIADTGDIRISSEHKSMMIRLRHTKTGDDKWVDVRNGQVQTLVRGLLAKTKPGTKVFNFTTDTFRRTLKGVCAELGLSPLYVPHSLRHGGATHYHHILKMTMEDVLERGRWKSMDSARRYIQSGVAVLLDFDIPTAIRSLAMDIGRGHNLQTYLSLSQQH
jgi:integrase